jgi:basic membrane lipoprotein Med (substrate-binding protein (PBP1-ABC) superfamily)/DNA-binding SARP family transcriptional activator
MVGAQAKGEGRVEFALLGPLEVVHQGQQLDLGPHKQRSLLALLLIHANRVVSTDRILDELWGADAEGKENALWVYVSRLRSVLEPERVERGESNVLLTQDHGYILRVDPESIDAHRFESAATEGRSLVKDDAATAAEILRQALRLWRGTPLQDFAYDDFAQTEITRLEELRLKAVEDRIEADLRLGQAGELVGELEALQQQHPMQERFVGQLMVALYRSGRQADALRTFGRFRRHIGEELGIDPSPELRRLEEQVLLHDSRIQARLPAPPQRAEGTALPSAANPFKGLRAFDENDSSDFFGRDRVVADVLRRIDQGERLLGLVGPSGSGKSSVVRAGLIPALRKGAITGSDEWVIAQMVPGSHPFAELEVALLRASFDPPTGLQEQMADPKTGILRAALRVLPSDRSRLLLVIDQLEELFTLVEDEAERSRFLANLLPAIEDPHGRITVVLTLRADFYDRPLMYPEFGARLGDGVVNVVPLTPDELETAAQKPAERAGMSLEPPLLAALLTDVVGQPGALPLFQYTLTELFDRRVGETLSLDSYRAMHGVRGALTRRADDLYAELDPEQQAAAKQLFLRLVTITDSDEWGRRRVRASEIVSLDVDVVALQRVIDRYTAHRLLTVDRDYLTGSPTVEVAHEALLTEWDRLREWIEESRDDVRRHASLTTAMSEWSEADRDAGFLLSGTRLEGYEQWVGSATMQLTTDQKDYLDAAIELREQARIAEDQRVALETKTTRSARRRLWGLVAAVVALGGLASFVAFGAIGGDNRPTVAFYGYPGDSAFGANIASGLDRAASDFNIDVRRVEGLVEPLSEFLQLAEDGPDLIISDATPTDLLPTVFADFPDVRFAVIEGFVESPNTAVILFSNEQGSFLVGAAAALKSETGVIGFVGGFRFSALEEFRAGYEAGARYIDPDIEILATYIQEPFAGKELLFVGPFGRPDLGQQRATVLYERGADVVFHAAGTSGFGVFEAAVEQSDLQGRHLWAIGVDNDQWFQVDARQREHILTSMIKRADIAVYLVVEQLIEGTFTGGIQEFGLVDDAFDFSRQGDGLTSAMIEQLEQIKADIAGGRIHVPTEPRGDLLVLDPLPEGFDAVFADLSLAQMWDYSTWLEDNHTGAVREACYLSGTVNKCGQFLMNHLDEWLATTN